MTPRPWEGKMSDKYILEDHTPVRCDDSLAWGRWHESAERHVADETIGEVRISTVFLGLDHQWGKGPPLLFETMIFGGEHDEFQERCSTWDEAVEMHARAKRMVVRRVGVGN